MALSDVALPLLRCFDPERAHRFAIKALKCGLGPQKSDISDPFLASSLWGMDFPNPVGLAAGFDKNAEVTGQMLNTGFGFVEAGSLTPKAQPGNPQPRIFRLLEDRAIINRLGFNNNGVMDAASRLKDRPKGIIGINLGKNKSSEDAASDYAFGAKYLAPLCDYLVINVSSPNTPGLRALQGTKELTRLISATQKAMAESCDDKTPPLLVKIAPDLTDEDKQDIADVALASGIQGLIISNTTISRPDGLSERRLAHQTGGLSGKPLFDLSTQVLHEMYKLTQGKLPLIGVGGISSGQDAYIKIKAGASLVQLYSALVYEGFGLIPRINKDLILLAQADGFKSISQAIGTDHK